MRARGRGGGKVAFYSAGAPAHVLISGSIDAAAAPWSSKTGAAWVPPMVQYEMASPICDVTGTMTNHGGSASMASTVACSRRNSGEPPWSLAVFSMHRSTSTVSVRLPLSGCSGAGEETGVGDGLEVAGTTGAALGDRVGVGESPDGFVVHPVRMRRTAAAARAAFLRIRRCYWCGVRHHSRTRSRTPQVDSYPVALTIGIVGLPNVGKSTLFNALTKNDVLAANYPFATIEPNVGVVNLPDPRLDKLAEIFGSERILPAAVSFVDIAGIVRGASEGEGLGNQFLANIREADAIAQVVRGFSDDDVVHVDGAVNPASDMETINAELMLADLQTVEKAITRYEKEVRGKKIDPSVLEAAKAAKDALERGILLSTSGLDLDPIRELGLLTVKPVIFVFNVDESVLTDDARKAELAALVAPAQAIFLDAKIESELKDLDPEDAAELLASTGQDESGLDQLARIGFDTLGLQTYLTAGPKEARAWTIGKGWKAPQAAGVIHTDFEKGFIKAEIVSFDDLVETGSVQEARAKGKARLEGKDYVMQDGDVVEFRIGNTSAGSK